MTPRKGKDAPRTLWQSDPEALDREMLAYTVGDDPLWDTRLLRWDILGSLGHIEGLSAARLLSPREHGRLRRGLREALRAAAEGSLVIEAEHEDVHSAVEDWLTRRLGKDGARVHTGRSRNDQVACDIRLYLKANLLDVQESALLLTDALVRFAQAHARALWPGYTHLRRAMPSSAGLWAGAFAEGILDTVESLPALWRRVDRSPLGSAAGYGVPLPLNRERVARALGFGGIDHNVATVQNGRGKLEAAVLFWCVDLAHDVSRYATDVILLSGEEFGLLRLPTALATGSSIMPHKRNPDLFELTRARAAALEGDLVTILQLKAKLTSGYHRDFQLLKEPLFRGLDRTGQMLRMMAATPGRLEVNRDRARDALEGGVLATDEVMRRVEEGTPFRHAYQEVARALTAGDSLPAPSPGEILDRRTSTGGVGNPGLPALRARVRAARRWAAGERRRFDRALARLAGASTG